MTETTETVDRRGTVKVLVKATPIMEKVMVPDRLTNGGLEQYVLSRAEFQAIGAQLSTRPGFIVDKGGVWLSSKDHLRRDFSRKKINRALVLFKRVNRSGDEPVVDYIFSTHYLAFDNEQEAASE
jgi:hypothetical protein